MSEVFISPLSGHLGHGPGGYYPHLVLGDLGSGLGSVFSFLPSLYELVTGFLTRVLSWSAFLLTPIPRAIDLSTVASITLVVRCQRSSPLVCN